MRNHDDARRGLGAAAIAVAVANLSLLMSAFVRTKVVALDLGVDGSGVFAQLQSLMTLAAAVASLGLVTPAVREVAAASAAGDQDALRRLVSTVAVLPAAAATVAVPLVWVFRRPLTVALLSRHAPSDWVVLATASVPFTVLSGAAISIHQGLRRTGRLALVAATSTAVGIAVTVALIVTKHADGAAWSLLAAAAASAAVLCLSTVQLLAWQWRPQFTPRAVTRRLFSWGAASLIALSFTLGGDLIVRTVAIHRLGARANGLYQPVYLISNSGFVQISNAVAVVLLASLSGLVVAGSLQASSDVLDRAVRSGVALVTALTCICIAGRSVVLTVVTSSAFSGAGTLLGIQLVGEVPRIGAYAAGAALLPLGRVRAWLFCGLIATVVRVSTCLALIPAFGTRALAASYALEWVIVCFITMLVTRNDAVTAGARSWSGVALGTAGVATAAATTGAGPPWDVIVPIAVAAAALGLSRGALPAFRRAG